MFIQWIPFITDTNVLFFMARPKKAPPPTAQPQFTDKVYMYAETPLNPELFFLCEVNQLGQTLRDKLQSSWEASALLASAKYSPKLLRVQLEQTD